MYHVLRQTRRLVLLGAVVGVAAVLAPFSAFSADTGTVNAQVVVGVAPCILISSPPSGGTVSFGSLAFSTTATPVEASGVPDISVATCAPQSETLLASGTNATGAGNSWTLQSSPLNCLTSTNAYRLALRNSLQQDFFLTTQNQGLFVLSTPGQVTTHTPRITMPCTGSSGNGATMTMSYNFTATIP